MASLPDESATSPPRPPGSAPTHAHGPGSTLGASPALSHASGLSPPGSSLGSGSASAPPPGSGAGPGVAGGSSGPLSLGLDPSQLKLTRGHSCILCQSRKVRCDKNKPCANCVKANVECRVVPPQPPRRRKKKPHERELIERLRKYELLLSQHGIPFDPIFQDFKPSDAGSLDDIDELEQNLGGLKTSPGSHSLEPQSDRDHNWFPFSKEETGDSQVLLTRLWTQYKVDDDVYGDSSGDDEPEGKTLHHAFDRMFDNQDGFPFVIGGGAGSVAVTDKHPPGIQIFQLWQVYLNQVNPLLKITHTPSLQGQIIEAGANPAKIPKPLEALMFSIYLIAITSMHDDEVHSTFGEEKPYLLGKYHAGAQQALLNAGFMRSPDLTVLQAYLMYLLSIRQYVDPRSLFCLIGIAVRIAQRLGLHRDGAQLNQPPFEVEMRRRLWWQLVAFDKRIAEITGSTITALSSSNSDCKVPLNINDTDLHQNAKDPPPPYAGPTEMLFVLSRIELITAAPTAPGLHWHGAGNKPKFHYSVGQSSPDVVTHMANQNLPAQNLDDYCRYVEEAFLKQCDRKIPLHLFTLMFTKQNLCRLRVIAYLVRTAAGIPGSESERDTLFIEAINMVEYDNVIQATDSLRGFLWYTHMYFPLPGYMFLVHELRARRTGSLVERAWDAIIENHDRRGLLRNLRTPIYFAFSTLFLRAWDARQSAEAQLGNNIPTPQFINVLRHNLSRRRGKPGPGSGAPGTFVPPPQPSQPQPHQPQPHHQQQQQQQQRQQQQSPPQGQQHLQQQHTPDHTPSSHSDGSTGGMTVDEPSLFPGFDDVNQFFGGGDAAGAGQQPVPDLDFGQMDWISIMPEISNYVGALNHQMGVNMAGGVGVSAGIAMAPVAATLQPQQQPRQQQRQQQPQHQQQHALHQLPQQQHPQQLPHHHHQQQQQQQQQQHSHLTVPQPHYQMRLQQ